MVPDDWQFHAKNVPKTPDITTAECSLLHPLHCISLKTVIIAFQATNRAKTTCNKVQNIQLKVHLNEYIQQYTP